MIVKAQLQHWVCLALLALAAWSLGTSSSGPSPTPPLTWLEAGGPQAPVPPPLRPGSVRFVIIGDSGTGDSFQNDVALQMVKTRAKFPFDFVVMLGDNIYGGHSPRDFSVKFERPYQVLLDAGVKFYASLGNHDDPSERFYQPFNMGGQRYYAYSKGNVRFVVLDSNYMDPAQIEWLENEMRGASSPWKIVYCHHPLYSDGSFHGPNVDLRTRIEPLLEKYGVNVVFSGHEHVYERIKPQHGIYYFILGNAGELRYHNLKVSPAMASGFDEDRCFMLTEVAGDELYFQTISRTGKIVDSGVLQRQQKPTPPNAQIGNWTTSYATGF
jgi:predicted MPP superfamily phosphohydrolase